MKQANAGLLMAQLQVVTGRQGVYMMYPGPAANGVVVGGHLLGLLWGWVVGLRWVVWICFWVLRWIKGLGPIWGLGLLVGLWGFEQSGALV